MLPPLCQIAFSQISAEIDALDARINELQNRLAGQSQTQAEHAGEMETSDEACRIRQRDLDTLTTHIAETELQLRRERQDLLMAESEITRHRSAVTNIEVDLKSYQSRHADHANALHQLREQRAALEARHSETQTLTEARRAEIATARTQADATANEAKHLASEFRRIQLNLDITSPLFFHLLQSDKARCGNQYLGRGGREDLFYEQQNDNSTRH